MNFMEMWQEADQVDAEIGGMDSVPEEEQYDYQMACLMALSDDFKYGQEMKELSCNENQGIQSGRRG